MAKCFCVNDVEKIRPWKIERADCRLITPGALNPSGLGSWTLLIGDKISLRTAIHRFSRKKNCYLYSLVCVGQESYHHVDKKNNPHNKKGPKQKFSQRH